MLINGLNKTTLLDYPGRVAATIFTGGCNFRCPFCHNAGLVLHATQQERISEEEVFLFLEKRKNILKGLCITGGEPTLQPDLPDFIQRVRELSYAVKLDTNGYNPTMLAYLLDNQLLDYVAMDIKNCPNKYAQTVGADKFPGGTNDFLSESIYESVQLLKDACIDYEFRTTVVREFHTKEDLLQIAEWIKGCPRYFLQNYEDNDHILAADSAETQIELFHGYEKAILEDVAEAIRQVPGMTGEVHLRGVE